MKPLTRSPFAIGALVGASVLALGLASIAAAGAAGRAAPLATVGSAHRQSAVHSEDCGTAVTSPISPKGGLWALSSCDGLTGRFAYGKNNAPAGATITWAAYTSNPNTKWCAVRSGQTPFFYFTGRPVANANIVTFSPPKKTSILEDKALPYEQYGIQSYTYASFSGTVFLGYPSRKGKFVFGSPIYYDYLVVGETICLELIG
jgi:hypothetical protein